MSVVIGNAGNELELTIPSRADVNWDAVMQAALTAITTHNHDGINNGATVASSVSSLPLVSGNIIVGNASNLGASVAVSGDATLANTGALAVAAVGGSTAADIHTSQLATAAATNANTASAIVRRDGSGNFAAGTITAALTGTASGNAPAALASGDVFVGNASNIAAAVALTGDVSITNAGATTVGTVGTSSAANVHAAELLANAATSANTASAILKRDGNKNALINTIVEGLTTTVTSATPVVLTNASTPIQEFTGTTAQTVTLPDATTLAVGWPFTIINKSTAIITVKTNGAATLISLPAGAELNAFAVTIGASAGTWDTTIISGQGQLLGTATNDTAAAGNVGEVMRISRVRSVATAMTSPSPVNVCTTTSITLTAGDWNVQGMVGLLTGTATSVTDYQAAISKVSASLPATDTQCVPTAGECRVDQDTAANVIGTAADISITIPPFQVTVATTLQLFLVAKAVFSASTLSAYGSMEARRIR